MARTIQYTGKKIRVELQTDTGPDGRPVQRDVVVHPGAVAVLAFVDDEHVCLLRNRRPAVGETLLEVPAGTLETGEAPEAAAARELAEETGYRAADWHKLTEFYPSPGVLSERTHLFLARQLTPGPSRPEQDEELETVVLSWDDAVAKALDGTIRDAKTLIAVLLWEKLGV